MALSLKKSPRPLKTPGSTAALLFFEPSTRTRLSFEIAALRAGVASVVLDGGAGSSLQKGESIEDTILNVAAMNPDFLVVRCADSVPLAELSTQFSAKVLNAGWGIKAHPTQALLDALTIRDHFGSFSGKKLLIIGDVKHSRVAASQFELMPRLRIEIAVCGPPEFLESLPPAQKRFSSLAEGLQWADVVIALRPQIERHHQTMKISRSEYAQSYGLNAEVLRLFSAKGIIMHPGPIHHGVEMQSEVLRDPRSRVLQQVSNGVYMREALIRWLGGEKT